MDFSKVRDFFENDVYGKWREGEKVSFEKVSEDVYRIFVDSVYFDVTVKVPAEDAPRKGKNPFIICMHPIMPVETALKGGIGLIFLDTRGIASDDYKHDGCFYELYPYEEGSQTGVLMAWAWAASKVLDAVLNGLGEELGFDPSMSAVTGVSRWGKATAVCGAFDKRFKMVIPTCSGAGGLALYSVKSEGKTYDLTAVGGPSEYTYSQNEPLSCLQSDGERGWFCDKYLDYKTEDAFPYDQEMLVAMAMSEDRYYFILAAAMGEDWVNAPSMYECYNRALPYYEKAGLSRHLSIHVHKEGHAVIEEDMELIIKYFESDIYSSKCDFLCKTPTLYME